jgi:hypothetical protein
MVLRKEGNVILMWSACLYEKLYVSIQHYCDLNRHPSSNNLCKGVLKDAFV